MVAILGANSVSGGYEVDNSVRFNDGDSPHLSKTFSGSAAYGRVFTLSFWIKRSAMGAEQYLFHARSADSQGNFARIEFTSGDAIRFRGYSKTYIQTNRLFRDPSAWYHIVLAVNTNDSTAGDRIKLYVNGVLESDLETDTNPDESEFLILGSDRPHFIGASNYNNSAGVFFDGYYAEFNFVDNTQEDVTAFGEFNDNGVWIPKKYTGTYSTNGFYLEFKETGTGTNASCIGADTSGNTHHFAPTNLAATDVTTDTCTNNFATFNSIFSNARSGFTATATLREGNTGATGVNTSGNVSTIGFDKGKWYWEIKIVTRVSNDLNIGIVSIPGPHSGVSVSKTMMWQSQDDLYFNNNQTNATKTADLASFDDDDIVAVALDLDASTPNVILYKNGTALNSGNAYNFNANERDGVNFIFPQVTVTNTSDDVLINFGNPAFAISSGNADADGHGNFEYAVPSGYFAICTKNLAEYGG